jgi:phosphate transporter
MKFSHVLKFNTVPEWREHYINYAALKKLIYQAEPSFDVSYVGEEAPEPAEPLEPVRSLR